MSAPATTEPSTQTHDIPPQIDDLVTLIMYRAIKDQNGPIDLSRLENANLRKSIAGRLSEFRSDACKEEEEREHKFEQRTRTVVLLLVVTAMIALSAVAMINSLDGNSFNSYLAPVAGMSGTVLGYWFGATERRAVARKHK